MPVNLPNQPHGLTRLPAQPNDPPTLNDITNSVMYNQQLLISFRKEPLSHLSFDLSLTCIMISEAGVANSASSDDVGRGEVYKAQLVQAQAGASECFFNVNSCLYDWTSFIDIAPPWFAPALAAGLAVGLAPLTHIAHTVSSFLIES